MSGFSAAWLALREPADARARDAGAPCLAELRAALEHAALPEPAPPHEHAAQPNPAPPHGHAALPDPASPPEHAAPPGHAARVAAASAASLDSAARTGAQARATVREVLDLGAGSGSNLRYLASRLPPAWRWTLVDHDPVLLALAAGSPAAPRIRQLDLARELDRLELPAGGLVTASALLDLVSESWLAKLAQRCRTANAAVLFALTYDGRSTCRPMDIDDTYIVAQVNRHQRRDKGFGPALGPDAATAAAGCFARAGYLLRRVRTDWRIEAQESRLQAAVLEGWALAARELDPAAGARIDAWLQRRLHHLERGRSRLIVGHEDLYGWPVTPTG